MKCEGRYQGWHGCVDHDEIVDVLIGIASTNIGIDHFWLVARAFLRNSLRDSVGRISPCLRMGETEV
jgi:hypothetical protein